MAIAGGIVLFVLLLAGVVIGYDLVYYGAVYPGVSVAGMDLTGLTPEEASRRLAEHLSYPLTGKIVFYEGQEYWIAKPEDLGLFLDPEMSAMAAYSVGRQGGLVTRLREKFTAWYWGKDMPPLMVYDERRAKAFLDTIAAEVNLPTVEGHLEVNGLEVIARPGQVGRTVDPDATLAPLHGQFESMMDGLVPLVVRETPPQILDVTEQAEIARQILSAPLTLTLPDAGEGDPGPWTLPPEQLAQMLVVERVQTPEGAEYQVRLNASDALRSLLTELEPQLRRTPDNARFIFNDETRELEVIQPAVIGRALDVNQTIERINQQVSQGEHTVALAIDTTPPEITDDVRAADLGITELIRQEVSYFYGSSSGRIQNIATASARFHGVLVPPGAVFSMAQTLGDISLDNGYAEALIIYGNRTIQGVGGGVCQVSTTLFRTAFFAGYPVVERHPHAYRVGYYEQTRSGGHDPELVGLDATVFVPQVDFKFKNDTPYWLLMETYVNPDARTLTWKFYSTSDGRSVEMQTTGLKNVTDPPDPLYQENDELSTGEIKQVDWAVAGGDVTISRTVYRNGEVYLQDAYTTNYIPWRAVYEYGPGTDVPKD